jgi:hypothetical protein
LVFDDEGSQRDILMDQGDTIGPIRQDPHCESGMLSWLYKELTKL